MKYGVLNTERNRMVTSHSGTGVFTNRKSAENLKNEMGGQYDSHLTVVSITPVEE